MCAVPNAPAGSVALAQDETCRQTCAGERFVSGKQLQCTPALAGIGLGNAPGEDASLTKDIPRSGGPGWLAIGLGGPRRQCQECFFVQHGATIATQPSNVRAAGRGRHYLCSEEAATGKTYLWDARERC